MQLLKSLEVKLRRWRDRVVSTRRYQGDAVRCPACGGGFAQFLPAGTGRHARQGAVCPGCRSRERDRLTWLFLRAKGDQLLWRNMQFLHIAPEPHLSAFLSATIGEGYITADLVRRDVMVRMDVQDMLYPNESLDAIYCSHVLQDVPNDRKALSECFRVLRPGGWAIVTVPQMLEKTEETATPGNRRAAWDKRPDEHLRRYGRDFSKRPLDAGFSVEVITAEDLVTDAGDRKVFGIDGIHAGVVNFLRKPSEG